MKRALFLIGLLTAPFYIGCSPPHAQPLKPKFVLSRVRRVYVEPFEGSGGSEVAKETLRALLGGGLQVVNEKSAADAILTGVVTEYRPARKLMIVLGNTQATTPQGTSVGVSNPVVSSGGPMPSAQSPGFSANNPHIVAEIAVVGLVVRLLDSSSHNILWAYEYMYESVDLPTALQIVVSSMTQSLKRATPSLQRQKPVIKKEGA